MPDAKPVGSSGTQRSVTAPSYSLQYTLKGATALQIHCGNLTTPRGMFSQSWYIILGIILLEDVTMAWHTVNGFTMVCRSYLGSGVSQILAQWRILGDRVC